MAHNFIVGQRVLVNSSSTATGKDEPGVYKGANPSGIYAMIVLDNGDIGGGPNGEWLVPWVTLSVITSASVVTESEPAREWQIGDEIELFYAYGSASGHFGTIVIIENNISIYQQRLTIHDYTNKSRGITQYEGELEHKLWYTEGKPTSDETSYTLRLRKPAPPAETRIGLVREELDWSAHEELKRLALGNQK